VETSTANKELFFYIFSSPEANAQGELLVSNWNAPAFVVRHHASTFIFFSATSVQIHFQFGLWYPCDSHNFICSYHLIGLFGGSTELKVQKLINIFFN
jgi:hypothetical protein